MTRESGSNDTESVSRTAALSVVTALFFLIFGLEPLLPADFELERKRMVEEDLRRRGIFDKAVLSAMLKVPRHLFVEERYIDRAYADSALPIKENQTISQPYVVALMTQSAQLSSTDRVLEVGAGSGYQTAILAEVVKEVFSIEIVKNLANTAKDLLQRLGYKNVQVRHGDGYKGWEDEAPFDAIIITAAAPKIPEPLLAQLKVGGRLIIPLSNNWYAQDLMRFAKEKDGLKKEYITGVMFVPMTGKVRE